MNHPGERLTAHHAPKSTHFAESREIQRLRHFLKAQLMRTKTLTAISFRFAPLLLAGVIGCSSESPIEIPKAPSSADDSTTLGEANPDSESENAPRDNPRIAKFAELDTNRDGLLNLTEFTGERKPKEAEKWFRLRDVDGDGFVNLTEYAPPLPIPKTKPKSKEDTESKEGPVQTPNEQPPTAQPTTSESPKN